MSSQLLPISSLPSIAIAKAQNQTPLKPSSISISSSPLPSHTLSERTHIPSHVYRHPAAVLLELCTSMKELCQIIPLVIKNGLYNEHLFQTKLVSLFSKYGSINEAARVFEPIEDKIDVLYHTMLKGYAKNSSLETALAFLCRMRYDDVKPVVYNFTYLLKVCGDNADLKRGREIHGNLIKNSFGANVFAMTGVVNMYAKCRQIHDAHKMFDRMPVRDLVSWNTIITGFSQNGFANKALELVLSMQDEGQRPDSITLVTVLPAAADIGSLMVGKSIHGYAIRAGFSKLVNISTALVDMYSKCGSVDTARLIFDGMEQKTVVSWNSMMAGYVQSGEPEMAIAIFEKMLEEGIEPTNVTIMEALHACADLGDFEMGKFVHKFVDKLNLGSDISIMNSLISMYSKCNRVDIASDIFKNLHRKTLVSWNAMILGYTQNGRVSEALNCFCEMQSLGIKSDSFTMVSVIPALAELSVTRQAKWIHGLIIRSCLDKNIFVATALVDMYAKCGAIHMARKLFDMIDDRHVITWNAMIDGYGTHGLGRAVANLFDEMRRGTVEPNDITFLCVISACSHSGLVDEGLRYFESMKQDYGLEPSMDHYGAMVDLLGRAGRIKEAWDFIGNMPVSPGITVYGAMLGACKIHKNVEFGEKSANKLFEMNPDEGGYHVLLANIYASASKWGKVAEVRRTMEKKGLKKTPGCSFVELRNEVHSFYSGSTTHPQSKRIYAFLEVLGDEIKAAGYVPDTNSIHDVEDDVQEQLLNSHSEKLAIAFSLLNTSPNTTIHVRKNLRVCGDMHRFHHFKNGTCSCGDYW
ncbi:pentatricopeptide repeat-containing protein At1g11290, chloroplastic isoform X2 [Cucurbita maxima]|uniref:Pentatricopeptide repeat-containing protein At1g11290, chloroplastic isoform X2 n=1 Tax=Cucurbita maxima TaxID=3661 RepID=A0A6J1HTZ0_CUCMA|nr:pentatricopeptide repeat-containing protein At1g11290, chloroplastic isoform X2 [Cucurbita maxima]